MKPKISILHLEDSKNDAEIVEATLTSGGIDCDIILVDNQVDFSLALEKGKIDVIISDYNLPSFDGLSALAMAKEKCPKTPFIFISGAMGEEAAVETLKMGAKDYVLKDRMVKLIPAVQRALREAHEEELEERNRVLKAKYEIQREFLMTVSHELRTPMNAILGFSSLLAKTSLNEKQTSYIDQIHSSGQLLLGIIDDILDFSKLDAGKIKLEIVDFNLADVIADAFKIISIRMRDSSFETYVDLEAGLFPYIKGDPSRLKQILVNLLGNAFKFTSQGSVGIIVKNQGISADSDMVEYLFIVKDTGIGIAPENIEKLFKPFTQADGSTTRIFGGTGLGLSICKSLLEMMGGRIWVESELGHGSQFMFTAQFKRGKIVGQGAAGSEGKASAEGIDYKRIKVLAVEDSLVNQMLLQEYFNQLDCPVDFANNGKEAIEKLKSNRYNLVFMDLQMPVMGGIEATTIIRKEISKDLPIVALTASVTKADQLSAVAVDMTDFLTKPVSLDKLREKIDQYGK